MNREAGAPPELAFTGERFVPGTQGEIWIEHWHRYHFAARWAAGRRVLDVACGEGYGTALLAKSAAHVTGADLSQAAIDHARAAYRALANVEFACAPCTRLPLADGSIDVAVSFETIEHIAPQAEFLAELARVLVPGGLLILSCPNKLEYSDKRGFLNEFHVKELYRDELARLLAERFPHAAWYGQRPTFFSLIAPEDAAPAAGQLVEVAEADPAEGTPRLASPLYFVVVASRERASLDAMPPALSVMADRDDWVHRDYEKVMGELPEAVERRFHAERLVEERDRWLASLNLELEQGRRERDAAQLVADQRHGVIGALEAQLAQRDAALIDKDREIDRRNGWRWWLKLPLRRLGLLK